MLGLSYCVANWLKLLVAIAASVLLLLGGPAVATQTQSIFTVQLTLTASCIINSASTLDFGSPGVLTANVDQTSTVQVQCTNTTPYNIGLDAGANGGTTTTRLMKVGGAGAAIQYTLWQNLGRTTNWGNTVGTDTQASTGTGSAQSFTVYGRVAPQTTPVPGAYSDTITVTVTY
jgi:spore coat protein U-like protein